MKHLLPFLLMVGVLIAGVPQTALPPATSTHDLLIQSQPNKPVSVLTNRYNSARTGANLAEVILNQSNVNPQQFGKLFSRSVIGDIYAQPLYVPDVEIPGQGIHNVVYVATMHNMVYAFDADHAELSEPLWQASLGIPFTQNINADIAGGENGILSTPVIDPDTYTIYVVARTWENEMVTHNLHALDIRTGESRPTSPIQIDLSMPGTGINNVNGNVYLDSYHALQRTGLLLHNGYIYFSFGAHCCEWWFGWVAAYNAQTLQLSGVFNTTPNGYFGGIWMAGSGIATDGEFLYVGAGNGTFTADQGGTEYANSVLKLSHDSNQIRVVDWFTPANWRELDQFDADIGSGGVTLILNSNLAIVGAKDSNLYLVDMNQMGNYNAETNANLQTVRAGNGRIFSAPVYWENGPNSHPTLYAWAEHDRIKAFTLDKESRNLIVEPSSVAPLQAVGMPVGSLALSANGTLAETGILWAVYAPYADRNNRSGILVAIDATDLNHILWSSDINETRDEVGILAKFNPVTVANGKVYVASFSNRLNVYGLINNS